MPNSGPPQGHWFPRRRHRLYYLFLNGVKTSGSQMLACGPLIIREWFLSGGEISPKVSVSLPYRTVTSFRWNFKSDSSLLVPPDPKDLGLSCSSTVPHPFFMCSTGLPSLKPRTACTSSSIKETPPMPAGPCVVLPWGTAGRNMEFHTITAF